MQGMAWCVEVVVKGKGDHIVRGHPCESRAQADEQLAELRRLIEAGDVKKLPPWLVVTDIKAIVQASAQHRPHFD